MKMIMMAATGFVVFAAAATGSWFVKTHMLKPPAEAAAAAAAAEATPQTVSLTGDPLAAGEGKSELGSALMPVAVREKAMSVEELLRFSLSLKEREKLLKGDEEAFRQQQVQQALVLSDIKSEQSTIDGLRKQLSTDLASTRSMMDELTRLRDAVISEREKTKTEFSDIESKRIDITEQFQANDKKLSTWLQGMSSENAAAVLKEMANDGNMKVAVQLLANFEEREAAKILDSINDPKLLNEFIAEFRNLKSGRSGAKPGASSARPKPTSVR